MRFGERRHKRFILGFVVMLLCVNTVAIPLSSNTGDKLPKLEKSTQNATDTKPIIPKNLKTRYGEFLGFNKSKSMIQKFQKRLIIQFPEPSVSEFMIIRNDMESNFYRKMLVLQHLRFVTYLHNHHIDVLLHRDYSLIINAIAISVNSKDMAFIRSIPDIRMFNDSVVKIQLDKSVPHIRADKVWNLENASGHPITGANITIAIIDTGIDYMHPDLGNGFGPGFKVIGGYDFT